MAMLVSIYLQKTRMAFTKEHASKPVRQADMRKFCETQQGEGGGAQRISVVHYSE